MDGFCGGGGISPLFDCGLDGVGREMEMSDEDNEETGEATGAFRLMTFVAEEEDVSFSGRGSELIHIL